MARRFVRLEGFTRADRHEMTTRLSGAIGQAGGWLTDFHRFSNAATCLVFELPVAALPALREKLVETGLRLARESLEQLDAPAQGSPDEECSATLSVTFLHDEPDLLLEVPMVPG